MNVVDPGEAFSVTTGSYTRGVESFRNIEHTCICDHSQEPPRQPRGLFGRPEICGDISHSDSCGITGKGRLRIQGTVKDGEFQQEFE